MKWIKRILLGLLAVILLAAAVLYGWSATIIGKQYDAEPRTVSMSPDSEVIQRGERLAQVFGCFHGCHGADMEGSLLVDELLVARLWSPNLTQAIRKYSTSELEAIIRQGIRPDGSSVLAMPSDGFSVMTDEDLTAILSFIASYPLQDGEAVSSFVGPLGRFGLITGLFEMAAENTRPKPWQEGFRNDPMKLGEYLAIMACAECHGPDLEGQADFTPPLTIAKAYALPDFRKLMSTGVGLGDRDLGLMSRVAEFRFSLLTDTEVAALHTYLHSR